MSSVSHKLLRLSTEWISPLLKLNARNIPRIRNIVDTSARALGFPAGVTARKTYIHSCTAEWHIPVGADSGKVMLYLHGGGYAVGSIKTHRGLAARLAQLAGIQGLMIEYRKSPEYPFPAGLEDAVAAYKFLLQKGFSPQEIVLAGDSAGGGLVLALLLTLQEMEIDLPAANVLLSPWVDLTFSSNSVRQNQKSDPIVKVKQVKEWASLYAGEYKLTHPLISPIHADLRNLPPVMIQSSEKEVLTDDALQLHKKLLSSGVVSSYKSWKDTLHVWQLFWKHIPEADHALKEAAAFLSHHLQLPLPSGNKKKEPYPHNS